MGRPVSLLLATGALVLSPNAVFGQGQPPVANMSPVDAITTPPRFSEGGENGETGGEEERRDEIETDRDSFTPATTVAGLRRLIVESAYSFSDNRRFKDAHSFPELVLRYGITERIELRLGWNYEVGGEHSMESEEGSPLFVESGGLVRESQMSYGVKFLMTEQDRWRPGSAIILQGFTPTSGPDPATSFVGTYVFGWKMPNKWKLDSAFRYAFGTERGDHFNDWAPSVVLKVPVGEKWNTHVEYFGIFSHGKAEDSVIQFISPGLHYLVNDNFEVGIRVGWGLNDQSARFFTNVGFGARF